MGNTNICFCDDIFNTTEEKNFSRGLISEDNPPANNKISFIVQNNYFLGLNPQNNMNESPKFNIPIKMKEECDSKDKENEDGEAKLQIGKRNNRYIIKNNLDKKEYNRNNNNEGNIFSKKLSKNKNFISSQSTKKLNESDLNSIKQKSTICEYK